MKKLQDSTQRIPAHAQCWTGQQGRDQPTCGILCDLLLLGFLGGSAGIQSSHVCTFHVQNQEFYGRDVPKSLGGLQERAEAV